MTHVLIKMDKDWADEFDVYGFQVMTKEKWALQKAALESVKDETLSMWFGTNEGWEDDTGAEWLQDLTVTEITAEQAKVLTDIFGEASYGNFADISDLTDGFNTPEIIAAFG